MVDKNSNYENTSDISGFYKKPLLDRQNLIIENCKLSEEQVKILKTPGYFSQQELDSIGENVIGSFQLPFSIATNFKINGKDYLVPMVTEESSVVAAASYGAKIARKLGGFTAESMDSVMMGQIQITLFSNSDEIENKIAELRPNIMKLANSVDPILIKLGGGAKDMFFNHIKTSRGPQLILNLLVDVKDAMGANIVNSMLEEISEFLIDKIPGKIILKIISNLSVYRIAKCTTIFDRDLLGGKDVVENILDAIEFAKNDPFRAVTHNKGIMNGIDALILATGNDSRAIEAGAHAFATHSSENGNYLPLTKYSLNEDGNLIGELELPMAVGIVGGIINTHPMAQIALKILGVKSAKELAQVAVSVGLAQNIAALRALCNEGIQKGHMRLHSRKTNY
jgi:hydroxymethylglutaryl-CoA reductase